MRVPKPSESNFYLMEHIRLLRKNLRELTGKDFVANEVDDGQAAKQIYYAPFALLSHDSSEDPVFNYGNQTALDLFEMTWNEFISLPSRKSAEWVERKDRARLLKEVLEKGFIDNYSGIRISKTGKRFLISKAIVWNLTDQKGLYFGQAAAFHEWEYIEVR